jgi:hypothetical protein
MLLKPKKSFGHSFVHEHANNDTTAASLTTRDPVCIEPADLPFRCSAAGDDLAEFSLLKAHFPLLNGTRRAPEFRQSATFVNKWRL